MAQEINASIQAANTYDDLKPYAKELGTNLQRIAKVMEFLSGFAQKGDFERFISDATIFMDFMNTIVGGWQWLKMATHAKKGLVTGDTTYDEKFYESKIHTMKFYFKYEMKKTQNLADIIMDEEVLTIKKGGEVIV